MQSSPNAASGSAASAVQTGAAGRPAERSASPSKAPRVKVTSPRQESKSAYAVPLRMHDFYNADPVFRQMRTLLKVGDAGIEGRKLLENFASQLDLIRKAVLDAERSFTPSTRRDCASRLEAAKAGQVRLLGDIDDVPDDTLSTARREELHDACAELGKGLTKMMVQAMALEKAKPDEQLSPAQDKKKRSQNHPDSPPMTGASAKRRKTGTFSPQSPRSPGPGSSPRYQPASPADNPSTSCTEEAASEDAQTSTSTAATTTTSTTNSGTSGAALSTGAQVTAATSVAPVPTGTAAASTASPVRDRDDRDDQHAQQHATSPNSPQPRKHRLPGPQRRPRPASQLFTAPPVFGSKTSSGAIPPVAADGMPPPPQAEPSASSAVSEHQ